MPVSYLSIKKAHDLAELYHAAPFLLVGEKKDPDGRHLDKNGELYIYHLEAVSDGVKVLGGDSEIRAAALLHDIVEDTQMTYKKLEELGASHRQVLAIEAVTKRTSEPQTQYLGRVLDGGDDSRRIKLADLMHNLRPDRLALLPESTQNRLRKKYSPSVARLMHELGYIVNKEEFAAIPQGSSTYYSTGTVYEWAKRKVTWFSTRDEVKLGKDEAERVLQVKSKSTKGDDVTLYFETNEFIKVHKDTELMGRMKPYSSTTGGYSGSSTSSSQTDYPAPSKASAHAPTPATIPFGNTPGYHPEDNEDPWASGLWGYDGLAVYGE